MKDVSAGINRTLTDVVGLVSVLGSLAPSRPPSEGTALKNLAPVCTSHVILLMPSILATAAS